MKKLLFTLLLAAVTLPGWADETQLTIIGGATSAGWATGEGTEGTRVFERTVGRMVRTAENTWVWVGTLTTTDGDNGNFKITKGADANSWDGYWATYANEEVGGQNTQTFNLATTNDGDKKFHVTATGMYRITVDLSQTTKKMTVDMLSAPTQDANGYYQIGNADQFMWFAGKATSEGGSSLKAKLTADISFSDKNFFPLACEKHQFEGELDGAGHTIDYAVIDDPRDIVGIFRYLAPGANVHDLVIGSNCSFTGSNNVGGIAGKADGTGEVILSNVINAATIHANSNADGTNAAGFVAFADGATVNVTNCANLGQTSTNGESANSAAFIGWIATTASFTNCWNGGTINNMDGNNNLYRTDKTITPTNCYDVSGGNCDQCTQLATTAKGSGELCYKLNGTAPQTVVWHQTIGQDSYPILVNTSQQVYQVVADKSYTNLGTKIDTDKLLLGTPEELEKFSAEVNAGNIEMNAKLSADITASSYFIPIGTEEHKYKGTFDGDGKSITFAINSSSDYQALVGHATGGATITNLILKGSITSTGNKTAGFIAEAKGGGNITITNCGNEATITGAGGEVAAIIANNIGGDSSCTLFLTNVYNIANVSGSGDVSTICGYQGNHNSVFTNVYNSGTPSDSSGSLLGHFARGAAYRDNGQGPLLNIGTYTNCYSTTLNTNEDNPQINLTTSSDLTSGELCYRLNGLSVTSLNWYQTLGTDNYPVPFSSHGEMVLSQNDGWYEISEPWQLRWMAEAVNTKNGTYKSAQIKLINDIDYTAYTTQAAMLGAHLNPFSGTLDGQFHSIEVAFDNTTETEETALVRQLSEGTVKNLKVTGTITANQKLAGGICASIFNSGTIMNCESAVTIKDNASSSTDRTHGGILARVYNDKTDVTIKDCLFSGKFDASHCYGCGGVVGWTSNSDKVKITNCLVTGILGFENNAKNSVIAREDDTHAELTNCYFTSDVTGLDKVNKNKLTRRTSGIDNGELCYLLNGTSGGTNWTQTIDTDTYPIPFNTSMLVFKNDDTEYDNIEKDGDWYKISNANELKLFSSKVNGGSPALNAKLTNDIDMSGKSYTPIGTSTNKYAGTFDGQYKTIKLNINTTQDNQALFGIATANTEIKNLIVEGSVTARQRAAGFIGYADGNGTITLTNIINKASIDATASTSEANAAGFVGCAVNGIIIEATNCGNTGKISNSGHTSGTEQCAAFAGWLNKEGTTFTNCWNIGEISNMEDKAQLYRNSQKGSTTNCYYLIGESDQGVKLDATAAYTGELCYLLKGNQETNAFTQTIGTDAYPTFGSATVDRGQWFGDDYIYYNVDESGNITVNELNLDDSKTTYNVPAKVTAKSVTLTRTLHQLTSDGTHPRWNTFCSPVDIDKSNFSAAKELTGVTANGNNYSMAFTDVEGNVLEAGKPYMVQVSKSKSSLTASNVAVAEAVTPVTINGLTFTGNFTSGKAPQGSFIISNNVFYNVDSDVTLKAFRGYITTASNVKALIFDFDDDATSLSSISSPEGKECIYNLAGQRIQKMQKGINIVNGKKILF